MDEIQYNTPCVIKLGSFAGKIKYCLIDTFVIPLLKILKLKIDCINNQLIVLANDIPFHEFIWKYSYQILIPENYSIHHRNGITMDIRLENLFLISNETFYSPSSSNFYWQIISHLPVDMNEVDYHNNSTIDQSSLYECHNAPCTNLLNTEQFSCIHCKRIKYCSQFCRIMDADIHSIFCNPINSNCRGA